MTTEPTRAGPKYEPSDHDTTIAVLEGRQAPKVCPYCGRPWNPEARCVCQEPAPYVSPWARVWRWFVALVSPKPPLVIYSDELPRPQPIPRPAAALRGPTRQPPPKPTYARAGASPIDPPGAAGRER